MKVRFVEGRRGGETCRPCAHGRLKYDLFTVSLIVQDLMVLDGDNLEVNFTLCPKSSHCQCNLSCRLKDMINKRSDFQFQLTSNISDHRSHECGLIFLSLLLMMLKKIRQLFFIYFSYTFLTCFSCKDYLLTALTLFFLYLRS